jgi:hypothetical protein
LHLQTLLAKNFKMRNKRPELAILAHNLRAMCAAWDITEKQLGELAGANRAVVSNWRNQHNPPNRLQMRRIELACGFDEWALRERLFSPNEFPKQPLQTIEIGPRALAEPSPSYGGGAAEKSVPLLAAPGLEARLERIEAAQREQQGLLLEILRKLETMSAK